MDTPRKALARAIRHLRTAWWRGRLDDELREELAQHADWRARALVDEGVPQDEARRRAALAVGNITRLREEARDVWGFPSLDAITQDLRYGLRLLRRAPAFTSIAVLSLAIGIGAGAAVFSLADAVLLRKLPVSDPDALVVLRWVAGPVFPFESLNGNSQQTDEMTASTSFSRAAFEEMRRDGGHLVDVFGFADLYQVNLAVDGAAELGTAHAVSGNYFEVLGVVPQAGRALGVGDDAAGAEPAALISDGMWRRRFGRSPDVVGRRLSVNGRPFTIVGVTTRGFTGTGKYSR